MEPEKPPWDHLKIAYSFDGSPDALWNDAEGIASRLPAGWDFRETDMSGAAGYVAIFWVEGIPTPEAGRAVRLLLNHYEDR